MPTEAIDDRLRPFVAAATEADAERELERLVHACLLPLATAIVRRKLRSFGPSRALDARDQDDVISEAMVAIVERLHAMRMPAGAAPIAHLEDYAATVVHSACAHHIRTRHPARARLKNRLRYLLETHPRFAMWESANGDLRCGLARNAPGTVAGDAASLERAVRRDGRDWLALARVPLASAVTAALTAAGGAMDFDAFVSIAAAASDAGTRPAPDMTLMPSRDPSPEVQLDRQRFLQRVWQEVVTLPVRQRLALLLNLRDSGGSGVLWLLPVAGIATIRQIARILEIPDQQFAGLWAAIPLDDATIGERLGCTRQQVINLRVSARKRLANRLRAPATPGTAVAANLGDYSPSLKGNA